jgi:hypothetical protein
MWQRLVSAACIALFAGAGITLAQDHAIFMLRSGERISGELFDMGGSSFTIKIGNKSRRVRIGDVASIELAPGKRPAAPRNGEHLLVLRNGEVLHGRLVDIGGTHPRRITFRTSGKDRVFSSTDVSLILLGAPSRKR